MLTKRIIPCLDIRNRKVTKGVRFVGNIELGDPVEMAARYYDQGCDELVFYDITASAENRPIDSFEIEDGGAARDQDEVRRPGRSQSPALGMGSGIDHLGHNIR